MYIWSFFNIVKARSHAHGPNIQNPNVSQTFEQWAVTGQRKTWFLGKDFQ